MNKKIKVILSVLIAVVLITAGTFAWVNFSQNVVNEFAGDGSHPGGTTHDDFDHDGDGHGHHQKDVYIENWGKTPIFVRIRLDEYMEIGKGAGLKGEQNNGIWIPNPDNLAESLISTANIDDKTTWEPHIPDGQADICDTPADFHKYWQWGMGGSKYYMPVSETDRADPAYVDQNITEYDGSEPGVKQTLNADVITMADWIALGQPIGNYWVIDTDGWAYWAAPLDPDSATGLLLNSVTRTFDIEDSYYYAINVVVQMATKTGDDNYTDFYNDFDSDHTATDDGKDLLEIITDTKPVPATKVTINGGDRALNIGASYTPGCVVEPSNSTDGPVWTSSDNGVATVDPNTGKITGIGEGTAEITVTVGGQSDTVTITVSAVTKPLENLIITDGDPLTLNIGDEYPLHYTTDPADTTDKITWTSSDESVATVDPDTGVITAVDEGTAIITGTADSGVTADIAVNVSKSEIPAEFVQIGCGDQNLIVGDIYQVTPFSVLPSNTTDTMIWSSSDTSVARVDQKGEITAVGPGTAKITLTSGSLNDSINVTVKSPFIPIVDNGGQPYDNPLHNNDPSNQNNNFAMRVRIVYGTPMPDSSLDQDGSIPLSMIIPGTDYSDIGIKAADPSLSQYFYIGTDKADKPALMYKYIPENSVWEAADQASANSTPLVTMNLFLTKAGYADTPITVTLHYDSSQYIY